MFPLVEPIPFCSLCEDISWWHHQYFPLLHQMHVTTTGAFLVWTGSNFNRWHHVIVVSVSDRLWHKLKYVIVLIKGYRAGNWAWAIVEYALIYMFPLPYEPPYERGGEGGGQTAVQPPFVLTFCPNTINNDQSRGWIDRILTGVRTLSETLVLELIHHLSHCVNKCVYASSKHDVNMMYRHFLMFTMKQTWCLCNGVKLVKSQFMRVYALQIWCQI